MKRTKNTQMKIIVKREYKPVNIQKKDCVNLVVEPTRGEERSVIDNKRLYSSDYVDKRYKKMVFNGTFEDDIKMKDIIGTKENLQEFDILFMFNSRKYDPKLEYEEDDCKKLDEKLISKTMKSKRDMYDMIEKNMRKKRLNNIEYIIFSYKDGWSSFMYITGEERKCNLNEPDIRYVFKHSNIVQQSDMWYSVKGNIMNIGMKKFYKMRTLQGETHVEGNYFEMKTEKDEETGELRFRIEFYFKESIQEYFMKKLEKVELEDIKIIVRKN